MLDFSGRARTGISRLISRFTLTQPDLLRHNFFDPPLCKYAFDLGIKGFASVFLSKVEDQQGLFGLCLKKTDPTALSSPAVFLLLQEKDTPAISKQMSRWMDGSIFL